jgi:hypothetical protein
MKGHSDTKLMSEIGAAFEGVNSSLRVLMEEYNPEEENLHFAHLEKPDPQLYSQLVDLARKGLRLANKYKNFLKTELYSDGMFWYELFLAISTAALGVKHKKNQGEIPQEYIEELLRILVQISEFSVGTGGDIHKRNYEALGNTLLAFNSPEFFDFVLTEKQRVSLESVSAFVDYTIERVGPIL